MTCAGQRGRRELVVDQQQSDHPFSSHRRPPQQSEQFPACGGRGGRDSVAAVQCSMRQPPTHHSSLDPRRSVDAGSVSRMRDHGTSGVRASTVLSLRALAPMRGARLIHRPVRRMSHHAEVLAPRSSRRRRQGEAHPHTHTQMHTGLHSHADTLPHAHPHPGPINQDSVHVWCLPLILTAVTLAGSGGWWVVVVEPSS